MFKSRLLRRHCHCIHHNYFKMTDVLLATTDDGTIIYQRLTQKYFDEAREVTKKTLFTGGNISKTIGLGQDVEALAEVDQIVQETAKDGITIIAVDKNNDKVAGVAFNKILVKSQPFFEKFLHIFKNKKSRIVLNFLIDVEKTHDFFEDRKVDCVMEHFLLGTLPEYRNRGIAKKLTELSIDLAQKLYNGINVKMALDGQQLDLEPVPQIVTAIFTSFISQKIGRELGFEVVAEKNNSNSDIVNKIVQNPNTDTEKITIECKKLKKY